MSVKTLLLNKKLWIPIIAVPVAALVILIQDKGDKALDPVGTYAFSDMELSGDTGRAFVTEENGVYALTLATSVRGGQCLFQGFSGGDAAEIERAIASGAKSVAIVFRDPDPNRDGSLTLSFNLGSMMIRDADYSRARFCPNGGSIPDDALFIKSPLPPPAASD